MDRAALDAAMKHGFECGGWCPAGRIDEFGRIPDRYPLKEMKVGSFAERTRQNVRDSDGTVVIYCKKLRGGTEQTVHFCIEQERPNKSIDAAKISPAEAARVISNFVREKKIAILNVAGPRESEWPGGYAFALAALDACLATVA